MTYFSQNLGMKTNLIPSLLIATTLLSAVASAAEPTRLKIFSSSSIVTADGTAKPPFKVGGLKTGELGKFSAANKSNNAFLVSLAKEYTGKRYHYCGTLINFLPGETESEFRSSENALRKVFVNDGFRRGSGEVRKLVEKKRVLNEKSGPMKGNFYIYEVTGPSAEAKSHLQVHGYIFDSSLKQGYLLTCSTSR